MFWGNKDVPLLTVPNELSEVVLHTVRPHPLLRYQVRLRLSMYAHSIYYLIAPPLWGHGLCHWSDPCTTPTLSGVQRGETPSTQALSHLLLTHHSTRLTAAEGQWHTRTHTHTIVHSCIYTYGCAVSIGL